MLSINHLKQLNIQGNSKDKRVILDTPKYKQCLKYRMLPDSNFYTNLTDIAMEG